MCVYLFLMHGHSFQRICTEFGTWHPYTVLRMVMGVIERWLLEPAGSRSVRRPYSAANGGERCLEILK